MCIIHYTAKAPNNLRFAILAVDTVLLAVRDNQLKVLLMKIQRPPHYSENYWGVPGGLIDPKETAEEAAIRHLWEKAGAKFAYLEQLYTFSGLDRDPRGRVVSVAYFALSPTIEAVRREGSGVAWYPVARLPRLAFDHKEIIETAVLRLQSKLEYTNIAFGLLPGEFTLGELQKVYEIVLQRRLDKRNFRKKLFVLKLLVSLKKKRRIGRSRPAELYKFAEHKQKVVRIL